MSTPAAMSLTISHLDHDQRPVLVLVGELDANTAPDLIAASLEIIEQGARDIIVDTSGLNLCDSDGYSAFLHVAGRLRVRAGRLAIVAPSTAVRQALDEGGHAENFVIAPTVAGALYAIHRDHP